MRVCALRVCSFNPEKYGRGQNARAVHREVGEASRNALERAHASRDADGRCQQARIHGVSLALAAERRNRPDVDHRLRSQLIGSRVRLRTCLLACTSNLSGQKQAWLCTT